MRSITDNRPKNNSGKKELKNLNNRQSTKLTTAKIQKNLSTFRSACSLSSRDSSAAALFADGSALPVLATRFLVWDDLPCGDSLEVFRRDVVVGNGGSALSGDIMLRPGSFFPMSDFYQHPWADRQ